MDDDDDEDELPEIRMDELLDDLGNLVLDEEGDAEIGDAEAE